MSCPLFEYMRLLNRLQEKILEAVALWDYLNEIRAMPGAFKQESGRKKKQK